MSVVAWDGRTVAADRQATEDGIRTTCKKIIRICSGDILCDVGDYAHGLALIAWYKKGGHPNSFPKLPKNHDTKLIVFSASGVFEFDGGPHRIPINGKFMAWGAGKDIALGALAMGADARRAVKIASRYNVLCGLGVTALTVRR